MNFLVLAVFSAVIINVYLCSISKLIFPIFMHRLLSTQFCDLHPFLPILHKFKPLMNCDFPHERPLNFHQHSSRLRLHECNLPLSLRVMQLYKVQKTSCSSTVGCRQQTCRDRRREGGVVCMKHVYCKTTRRS